MKIEINVPDIGTGGLDRFVTRRTVGIAAAVTAACGLWTAWTAATSVGDALAYVDALILQVDLFSASGKLPTNLDQVQERVMDIRYSSKTRFNSNELRRREALKASFRRRWRREAGTPARS